MKQVKLSVVSRNEIGRGPVRRLRKTKKIPGVVYGRSGSKPLLVDEVHFRTLMRAIGDTAALIQIEYPNQETTLTVLKAIQRNSLTDCFEHLDFHEVSLMEQMSVTLPIRLIGEAYGVKNERGFLEFVKHSMTIRCLPKNLPEYIEVNVSELRVGQSIHIRDLPKLENVIYSEDPDATIAMCFEPKVQEEAAATVTATEATKSTASAKAPAAKATAGKAAPSKASK